MSDSSFHRFLGGSPGSVIVRLIVISLIVGAAMVFFNLTPGDLVDSLRRLIESILGSGIESLRTILAYLVYGAIVVVPIFLVVRLVRMGRG
jgi:Family of unknown function (DUF6460)